MSENKPLLLTIIGILIIAIIAVLLFKNVVNRKYEITFDLNDNTNENITIKVKENKKVVRPDDPTKEGYSFLGWYYNNEKYDFDTRVKNDITLQARWEEKEAILVNSLKLDHKELNLKVNETATLLAIITPSNANEELLWISSDEEVASVDKDGSIKALKAGSTTITVKTKNDTYTASCTVNVLDDTINVTSVSISGINSVNVGNSIKLTANIKPSDATNKEVIWTSSDEAIATVDNLGVVKGLKSGVVTITVKTVDGEHTATKKINVIQDQVFEEKPVQGEVPVESLVITGEKELNIGSTIKLSVTITPDNAQNKEVIWTSSDEAIATVDNSGNVTGIKAGSVTIKAEIKEENKSATYEVVVKEDSYEVIFEEKNQGEEENITFIVKKNGNIFTDYKEIKYNGLTLTNTENTLKKESLKKDLTKVTIVLKDGLEKEAKATYN